MNGNILLILNITAWIYLMISQFKKTRSIGIGTFILFEFIFCTICSYNLYNDEEFELYHVDLNIFVLIIFFFFLYITSFPLIREDRTIISSVQVPNDYLLRYVSIIYIGCSMVDLPMQIKDLVDNLPLILAQGAGLDMYIDARDGYENLGSGIDHVFTVIGGLFMHIGVFLAFYYILLNDPSKKKYIILSFISFLPHLFNGISHGQRGGMIQQFLFLLGTYLLFRRFYKSKVKKRIDSFILIIIVIVSIPFAILTISRFSDYEGQAQSSFFGYSGQQTIFFNKYAFDNNGIRYGDRVIPFAKLLIGCDNVPNNFMQRRAKYPKLFIDDGNFISYIGDFFLDFGPWLAIPILLLIAYLFQKYTRIKKRQICLYQLFLLEILMCIITIGTIKLWPYSEIVGNITLLADLFFVVLFRNDYLKQIHNNVYKTIKIDET